MEKTRKVEVSIDSYLSKVPKDKRDALERVRKAIKSATPKAVETISWGMPFFKYEGKQLAAFAAFKEHCSLFPMSGSVLAKFKKELKDFETSKGTIRFTVEKQLSIALIKMIVKERMAEIKNKS